MFGSRVGVWARVGRVPVHGEDGQDDAADVPRVAAPELLHAARVERAPAVGHDARVYPVLHLLTIVMTSARQTVSPGGVPTPHLRVGEVVKLRVELPLVSFVIPPADLRREEDGHHTCPHQHRAWQ